MHVHQRISPAADLPMGARQVGRTEAMRQAEAAEAAHRWRLEVDGLCVRMALAPLVRLTLSEQSDNPASYGGKVAFVSPEVDPITGQVRVWAEIDNAAGKLRPGQNVRMVIE